MTHSICNNNDSSSRVIRLKSPRNIQIFQCFVIPRLLFGLEVLPITQTQLNLLSKFYVDNLKRFQSLPMRTANCAVYLLLGALPVQAELHKRQLSLLYNVMVTTNETIKNLTERQTAVNRDNTLSYYSRVQDTLDIYQLTPLHDLKLKLPTEESWKNILKRAISNYWTGILKHGAKEKSTLKFMDIESIKIGQIHPV